MVFTFVFLAMAYEPQFSKTSRVLKAIVLMHILYMCYVFSLGSGAGLNPALGFAQTIYWIGLATSEGYKNDATLLWVYSLMPFIGAYLSVLLYDAFSPISA